MVERMERTTMMRGRDNGENNHEEGGRERERVERTAMKRGQNLLNYIVITS